MNIFNNNQTHPAVVYGLAAAGFTALIMGSMWLALYSTRYVPDVVGRFGSAAVYLSTLMTPTPAPAASTTPSATTTPSEIKLGDSTQTKSTAPATTSKKQTWTAGTPVAVAPTQTPTKPHYSGSPDLAVVIESIGYVPANSTTGDIVATTTIPHGAQIAVKFRVTNVGTNVSGSWMMDIAIPSAGATADQVFTQNTLVPGQPSEYIARFDNISAGSRAVVITLDPKHALTESSTANNSAASTVTVL